MSLWLHEPIARARQTRYSQFMLEYFFIAVLMSAVTGALLARRSQRALLLAQLRPLLRPKR